MTIKITALDNYVPNGTSLLTAGPGGPGARPPKPPLIPELREAKIRVEREQGDRDFIKAASEMAEEARTFRTEQQKLTGYEARGTVARTDRFLSDMGKRYRNRYAGQCLTPRFQALFEQAFHEVRNTELRRAAQYEVAQRHAEKEEILNQDLERRLREVREDPERLEEYLRNRAIFLNTQFKGQELESRLKKDESALISAAIQARVDMGDLGGAEFDLQEYQTKLSGDDRLKAIEKINRSLLAPMRTLPLDARLAGIDRYFDLWNTEDADRIEVAARRNSAKNLVVSDWQKLTADPVEYLREHGLTLGMVMDWVNKGWVDPTDRTMANQAVHDAIRRLQLGMGVNPPRLSSVKSAEELHLAFEKASSDEKVKLVREWASEYGADFPRLLPELGITPECGLDIAVAVAVEGRNLALARRLMRASVEDLSEFRADKGERDNIRAAVAERLAISKLGAVIDNLLEYRKGDGAMPQYTHGLRTLVFKLALVLSDNGFDSPSAAELAVNELESLYGIVADESLGFLLHDKRQDTEAVKTGLTAVRNAVATAMSDAAQAEQLAKDGRWINRAGRVGLIWPRQGEDPLAVLDPGEAEGIGAYLLENMARTDN